MSNAIKRTTSTNAAARCLDIVPRLMALAMCLNVAFLPSMAFANTLPPDDGNPWKFVKTSGYKDGLRVVQTTAYKSIIVDGVATRVTGTALVVPSAGKIGATMFKRILMKSPYALLGTVAVSALISEYTIDKEAQEIYKYEGNWCLLFSGQEICSDSHSATVNLYISRYNALYDADPQGRGYTASSPRFNYLSADEKSASYTLTIKDRQTSWTGTSNVAPYKKPAQKIPLTPAELGQYMLGEHPSQVDQGTALPNLDWVGVEEAFTPIPEDGTNPNWEESKANMQQTGSASEADTAKLNDTSTTTKVGPDGTTTTTTTTTTKNADGTTTTNTTTTTTKPDGTKTEETVKTVAGGGAASKDLPAFCSWAATVCDWIAWTKTNPDTPTTDTKVPVGQISESDVLPNFDIYQERVYFNDQCPAPIPIEVSLFGTSVTTDFSYQPLCDFMAALKPFVIAASYITGAYIISGVGRGGGNDG